MAISKLNPVAVNKRIAAFTASGTWTVPAGVTYAIAHIQGGGGGAGYGASAGNGGNSSVAFASGTVTGPGQIKVLCGGEAGIALAAPANSGSNANMATDAVEGFATSAPTTTIIAGASVTPAASITVTVGAGGTAGTGGAAGGSGYVYIEYYE